VAGGEADAEREAVVLDYLLEGRGGQHVKGSIHWATRGGRPAGPKDFVEIGGEEKKEPEAGRGAAPTPPNPVA